MMNSCVCLASRVNWQCIQAYAVAWLTCETANVSTCTTYFKLIKREKSLCTGMIGLESVAAFPARSCWHGIITRKLNRSSSIWRGSNNVLLQQWRQCQIFSKQTETTEDVSFERTWHSQKLLKLFNSPLRIDLPNLENYSIIGQFHESIWRGTQLSILSD